MKSALLLASSQARESLRRQELAKHLAEFHSEVITAEDAGYFRFVELILTGSDSRPLPAADKVDALFS